MRRRLFQLNSSYRRTAGEVYAHKKMCAQLIEQLEKLASPDEVRRLDPEEMMKQLKADEQHFEDNNNVRVNIPLPPDISRARR